MKVGLSNLGRRFGEQMQLSPLVAVGLEMCMTLGCNPQTSRQMLVIIFVTSKTTLNVVFYIVAVFITSILICTLF